MRVFLISRFRGEEKIHAEVLWYDKTTHRMKVRVKCGIEYERYFDPNGRYNKIDYRIAIVENEDAKPAGIQA